MGVKITLSRSPVKMKLKYMTSRIISDSARLLMPAYKELEEVSKPENSIVPVLSSEGITNTLDQQKK